MKTSNSDKITTLDIMTRKTLNFPTKTDSACEKIGELSFYVTSIRTAHGKYGDFTIAEGAFKFYDAKTGEIYFSNKATFSNGVSRHFTTGLKDRLVINIVKMSKSPTGFSIQTSPVIPSDILDTL